MKPKLAELFFGSRYMLPLWVLLGLWVAARWEGVWSTLDDGNRLLMVGFVGMLGAAWLKSVPKVWVYEQAKYKQRIAARDPEEVRQSRRRRLKQFVLLLLIGTWWYSLSWLTEHSYASHPTHYLCAVLVGGGLSLWAVVAIYVRLPRSLRDWVFRSRRTQEKPFVVAWCLPVPRQAAASAAVRLPDYCKQALETRSQKAEPEAQLFTSARSSLVSH